MIAANQKKAIEITNDPIMCLPTAFGQKKKYPFHDKIDLNLDPVVQSIFADTYGLITRMISTQCKPYEPSSKFISDHEKLEEKEYSVDVVAEAECNDDEDEEEKTILIPEKDKKDKKVAQSPLRQPHDDELQEVMVLPLTESEVRAEMMNSARSASSSSPDGNSVEDQLITSIVKQFEKIYFRSPSVSEIAVILSMSIAKLKAQRYQKYEKNKLATEQQLAASKKRLSKSQQLLASSASKGKVVDVISNAHDVVFECLVEEAGRCQGERTRYNPILSRFSLH